MPKIRSSRREGMIVANGAPSGMPGNNTYRPIATRLSNLWTVLLHFFGCPVQPSHFVPRGQYIVILYRRKGS
ncbi:uncharacterized protein BO80DRAFT_290118 [Aspergillus ibericus CBS 121593]|uniref:Uncharacterized protein n=1 Tax=Aspergillus ibericus CBS 121593 TaxID=1448316 RepID=A0A395GHY1_9EURO|nr:hypothetical protein BO80DRAFT_290118 [Aspergillus ibericus CBS 121593]RAK95000.1 hypothetical protein BO80DRAFT_290118 [Aspergillus ibericus CBS 121593]